MSSRFNNEERERMKRDLAEWVPASANVGAGSSPTSSSSETEGMVVDPVSQQMWYPGKNLRVN